ncbi:uncharacterized protein [Elaeis guineensis]|uniref:uncharacterized protein n=1 Tax=Elaeis guineensis var. tenera TaxID=51953 RepID=UPI003C6CC761
MDKPVKIGFIREAMYPDWLTNVVLVKKANEKWHMCIDFTDLNKAYPKDSYPLSQIDQLVDATSEHELFTFMDAFFGYNQIWMAPEDEKKIVFITDSELYCYKMMSFGLKNIEATYQRLVNKIFKNQIDHNIEVYVNDMLPIKAVLHYLDMSGRVAKWALLLFEFDIKFCPRSLIKAQVLTDFILECTIPDEEGSEATGSSSIVLEEQINMDSNPEDQWIFYVDGSFNSSGSGVGVILIGSKGDVMEYALWFEFSATNNEAEYEILIVGLRLAKDMRVKHLKVFSDSQPVTEQVKGKYEAQEENIKRYLEHKNTRVDALSKLTASQPSEVQNETYIEVLENSSLEESLAVQQIEEESCWIDLLLKYLRSNELPSDSQKARKIHKQVACYVLYDDKLYKRSFSLPLLRCLRPSEADYALREVHEEICGNHLGTKTLSYKILWQGYYWSSMQKDTFDFIRRCDRCQRTSNVQHQPTVPLTSITALWLFAQ